jgi:6-pyruvoyltetrahydropterin/6-carboxytetrahydropterin synthase
LHGHDWTVIVTVAAGKLDSIGVVMDFHVLERRLGQVIDGFHNRHLNDVIPFVKVNPSAENVAEHIATCLELPERVWLESVEVWETPENRARVKMK